MRKRNAPFLPFQFFRGATDREELPCQTVVVLLFSAARASSERVLHPCEAAFVPAWTHDPRGGADLRAICPCRWATYAVYLGFVVRRAGLPIMDAEVTQRVCRTAPCEPRVNCKRCNGFGAMPVVCRVATPIQALWPRRQRPWARCTSPPAVPSKARLQCSAGASCGIWRIRLYWSAGRVLSSLHSGATRARLRWRWQ